ncbi:nicotinamide riboside kinase 2 [Patella vulgata]|uniref:nicotinamide riboside kinase 2 n=1 Tax=Patella vulgata TaxID=6465 RepID=UPI0024A9F21C|nr:nicotinamide riboside kinase 2 [Patella vulgata]
MNSDLNECCTIIGISGCTNSGKTSLTQKLLTKFSGSKHVCQDTYFLEPGDERLEYVEEVNHNNWEKLSALDMVKMVKEIKEWIKDSESNDNTSTILFVEGFTIFNYSPLCELFDKKYFFTMDYDTCKQRRRGRNYIPSDPEGYFDKVVWPMYEKNKKDIEHYKDIVYHSGSEDQEKTMHSIMTDILTLPKIRRLYLS